MKCKKWNQVAAKSDIESQPCKKRQKETLLVNRSSNLVQKEQMFGIEGQTLCKKMPESYLYGCLARANIKEN